MNSRWSTVKRDSPAGGTPKKPNLLTVSDASPLTSPKPSRTSHALFTPEAKKIHRRREPDIPEPDRVEETPQEEESNKRSRFVQRRTRSVPIEGSEDYSLTIERSDNSPEHESGSWIENFGSQMLGSSPGGDISLSPIPPISIPDDQLRKQVEESKALVRQRHARLSRLSKSGGHKDDDEPTEQPQFELDLNQIKSKNKEEAKKLQIQKILLHQSESDLDLAQLVKEHAEPMTSRRAARKLTRNLMNVNRRSAEIPPTQLAHIPKSQSKPDDLKIAGKASSASFIRAQSRNIASKALANKVSYPHLPPPQTMLTAAQLMERAPSKEQTKPWNEEFQDLLDTEAANEDHYFNYKAMASLIKDFNSVAEVYGNIIIAEKFLPNEHKTIKPVTEEDGGRSFITQGILFTFVEDFLVGYDEEEAEVWEFGGTQPNHEKAIKMSAHVLKGLSCLIHSRVEGLRYPLMGVIHYRGFCVLAQSVLPIKSKSLVYGTQSLGSPPVQDPAVSKMMREVGARLNLSGQSSKSGPVGSLQIYRGDDDKYYVTHFEQLMPPEVPLGNPREVIYYRFRPTFLTTNGLTLCPDALSGVSQKVDREVVQASQLLQSAVIPSFAEKLSRECSWDLQQLITALHRSGLCCHHLGYLRAKVQPKDARSILLTEIVARTIKNELRGVLRRSLQVYKTTSEEPYKEAVFAYLKPVFSYLIPAPSHFEIPQGDSETQITPNSVSRSSQCTQDLVELRADVPIPVPSRQKTFFMELKIDSENPSFVFGLCGTLPHNHLKDATGYCIQYIDSKASFSIQGKTYATDVTFQKGSTIGILFNWKGKEIAFTKNDRVVYVVGVARGSFLPKLLVGKNTSLEFNFGPSFTFDIETFCAHLKIESATKEDDSIAFWKSTIKSRVLQRFPQCLSQKELQPHVSLRNLVNLPVLAERLEALAYIRLSSRLHTWLSEDDPSGRFSLVGYDIIALGSRLKAMDLCYFSSGVVQFLDVIQQPGSISHLDLGSTIDLLGSVYQHIPIVDPFQYFYIGQMFHWNGVSLMSRSRKASQESFVNAAKVYDLTITYDGGKFSSPQMAQVYLQKGILLIEMGNSPKEAVPISCSIEFVEMSPIMFSRISWNFTGTV